MNNLQVRYQAPEDLVPYTNNARTHSSKQIQQLATSIREFGFNSPILVDACNRVIAGHGRLEAIKLLGLSSIPTICLDHLTEAQQRAFVIADNRIAELADWDEELLRGEFQFLADLELDFGLDITGFEVAEIDIRIESEQPAHEEDVLPEPPDHGDVICRTGDIWLLGQHRVICADARDNASFSSVLGDNSAQLIFTDPPYNVPIDGHVSGLGQARHREFEMACGEMSESEFAGFLSAVLSLGIRHSAEGSLHYVCMDWRHIQTLLEVGNALFEDHLNLCVWNKSNGGMGSFYRSKHELVAVFKSGKAPHINNVQLGKFGRYRTNVWDYPGMTSNGAERLETLALHPTVKPVALIADVLRDASHRGDIVLDSFGGAGSTLLAAETTGRQARLIEIDPRYVDVTIQRWEHQTGQDAVLESTRKTFRETSLDRRHLLPASEKAKGMEVQHV